MSGSLRITDQYLFFWDGWPSQWHRSPFSIDGVSYLCAEQFMMAEKARVFGDAESEAAIMAAEHPRKQKSLGRKVQGFDEARWELVCRGVVYTGNVAKFTQNAELRERLMETGDRVIVEASPFDRVWGIGLGAEDPRALDRSQWQGRNWLGIAIMQVRDALGRGNGTPAPAIDAELIAQLERRRAMTGNI